MVNGLPSLQAVLLGKIGFVQTPKLHTPAVWHWSSAVHVTFAQGLLPTHTPLMQYASTFDFCVQSRFFLKKTKKQKQKQKRGERESIYMSMCGT